MKARGQRSVILYAHNLSSFDGYFILKACANHNIKLDILKRDTEIFFIKCKIDGISFEFRCSLLLLRQGLDKCAKSFQVDLTKLPMDHDWISADRLFYVGVTPFSGGRIIHLRDYVLKYCINDCIILYRILLVFQAKIEEFGLSLATNTYSIPGLAFRAFKQKYLAPKEVVNLGMAKSMEAFIRDGYYGGRTEVFRAYVGGGTGYYYDVKGMYAQAMKKSLPCGTPR